MPVSFRAAATAAAVCALHGAAFAADLGPPDRWLPWANNLDTPYAAGALKRCDVTPPLAAQWDQNQQQLAQRLAQTPLPAGWAGDLRGLYAAPTDERVPCKGLPLTGEVQFSLWRPGSLTPEARRTRLMPKGEGSGATHALNIEINRLRGTDELDWLDDGASPRMSIGRKTGSFRGHTVWNGRWLLVVPPQHPQPFLPAPLERVVNAWVAVRMREIEQTDAIRKQAEAGGDKATVAMFTKLIDITRARVAQARKLLEVPPAQRQGPAWIVIDEVSAQDAPGAAQVWLDNPAYFDKAQPRTAFQLLALDVGDLDLDRPAATPADTKTIKHQLLQGLDWSSITRSLMR